MSKKLLRFELNLIKKKLSSLQLYLPAFIIWFSSLFYFSSFSSIWIWILCLQIFSCICCLFFKSLRIFSLFLLILIIWNNVTWFSISSHDWSQCQNEPEEFYGILKSSYLNSSNHLISEFIKVEIWCGTQKIRFPVAQVKVISKKTASYLENRYPRTRIKILHLNLDENALFSPKFSNLYETRIYNQSYEDKKLTSNFLKTYFLSKSRYYLSGFQQGLFESLLLADRTNLKKSWKKSLQQLGVYHIFAISGLHVGILYFLFLIFCKFLLLIPLYYFYRGSNLLLLDVLSLIFIYLFLSLVDFPLTAIRAMWMLITWIIIRHFLTWYPNYFWLIFIGAVMLVFSPQYITDISFQLSFMAVLGIFIILPYLSKDNSIPKLYETCYKWITTTAIISLWLTMFMMPLTWSTFQQVNLLGFLNNPIHILFVTFIYLPSGLLTLLVSLVGYFGILNPLEFYLYNWMHFLGVLWEKIIEWNLSWGLILLY